MDDLISRETMKDLIDITTWYHQNRNKDMVAGASDEETAWFKAEDVYKAIENIPTAQQEITEKQVKEYCEKRCLIVLSSDAFHRLKSAQPDRRYDEWCTDCKEYDQEKHCCPRWNRVIRTTLQDAQRTGRWIDAEKAPFDMWYATCSECGKRQTLEYLNYCPNCGHPMEVEE